jgi:ribosome-associated protein
MQFIGKLMRQLEDDTLQAVRAALQTQRQGSAEETAALHLAERWREQIVADDEALSRWISEHPGLDAQQLRALVRQARKDARAAEAAPAGQTPRHGRAWREIFQLIKEELHG